MFSLTRSILGWQAEWNGVVVARTHHEAGCIVALWEGAEREPAQRVTFELGEEELGSGAIAFDGPLRLHYSHADYALTETVQVLEDGLLEITRTWTNQTDEAREVVLGFALETAFEPTFTFIPAVSYDGNRWGTGLEPKGLEREGRPWMFSYKRTALPGATFSENGRFSVGLFASDRDANSLVSAGGLEPHGGAMIHHLLWPEREEPLCYTGKDIYGPPREATMRLEPGVPHSATFYVSLALVRQERTGWTRTFDRVWNLSTTSDPEPIWSPEKVWELGVRYVREHLYREIDGAALFHIGLLPNGRHDVPASAATTWQPRAFSSQYEIGWCGQNLSYAHALLHDYERTGNEDSLRRGVAVFDTWTVRARLGNGLFYVEFDDVLCGRTPAPGLDTCNLGWGAWQSLAAFARAQQLGLDKPGWRSFGLQFCDFILTHAVEGDGFGKLWSPEGKCLDGDGTIGCFVLLPLIEAYRLTGEMVYLERAVRGFWHYVGKDLARMECTAGALDTHCIDKETAWPLLKVALDLYELTGEERYLEAARLAGYYLASWMMHFDALYPPDSDFSRYGYRTFGGTSVSTQHHHLDPWGALLCGDWLRLFEATKERPWLLRARATWANSLLCLSDGALTVRDAMRPAGSQNEAYLQCAFDFTGDDSGDGRINDWLVAWPGAFRLLTLMGTDDWETFRPVVS